MKKKINMFSFILSIVCIVFFFIVSSSPTNYEILGTHPFILVLTITLITLILGVLGFSGIDSWRGVTRSVLTIIITFSLSTLLTYIIFFGKLLN